MKRIVVRTLVGLAAAAAVAATVPFMWCSRGAGTWFAGDIEAQRAFARGVERVVLARPMTRAAFHTGSAQFDGEWLFGSYLMAGIGYANIVQGHPELSADFAPLMTQCIERMAGKEVRAFDAESWGEDALASLEGTNGHAAYLGYLNLLLGLHRTVFGATNYAALNDRITAALVRRMQASRIVLLETYPHEVYPVDNCFVIGSVGLHQKASGTNHSEIVRQWVALAREKYIDRNTGLLMQAVNKDDGTAWDKPRGSGTALGLLAIHYADPALAHDLYRGIKRSLARSCLGFGTVREYPPGVSGGGDIDSGPILFSYGLSATGFSIAGARMFGDRDFFTRLYASAYLFGAPTTRHGRWSFVSGGALGNAIMFAMLTAPRIDAGGLSGGGQ